MEGAVTVIPDRVKQSMHCSSTGEALHLVRWGKPRHAYSVHVEASSRVLSCSFLPASILLPLMQALQVAISDRACKLATGFCLALWVAATMGHGLLHVDVHKGYPAAHPVFANTLRHHSL